METDQLFLMDCYIKTIKVYYDKLPFFESDNWLSRTFVNFTLFKYSKLEVQETEYSEKKAESSLELNKGASCLFALRDEQLLELCRSLEVTVAVSDEIKGTDKKKSLASKNMRLPLFSTDLVQGFVQDSHMNETKVNEFFMCDTQGNVIAHMTGYFRVRDLGRRVITHFHFSRTLNNLLHHTVDSSENSERKQVSPVGVTEQITENLKSLSKRSADSETWKAALEFDIRKTKATEEACFDNVPETEKKDAHPCEKDAQCKEEFEQDTGTSPAEPILASELPSSGEADRDDKIADRLKMNDIMRSKAEVDDQPEVKCNCPFINFTKKTDNLEAKEFMSELTKVQCLAKTFLTLPSPKESSNKQKNVKNEKESSQRHGSVEPPCPCLMGDHLMHLSSCPCLNKARKLTHQTRLTESSDSPANEMERASGENGKQVNERGEFIEKLDVGSYSCTCLINTAKNPEVDESLVRKLEAKLFPCKREGQQLEKDVEPMALLADLLTKIPMDMENKCGFIPAINPYLVYSCTCMINHGFHFRPTQETNHSCLHAPLSHRVESQCQGQASVCSNSGTPMISGLNYPAGQLEKTQHSRNACLVHSPHMLCTAKESIPQNDCLLGKRTVESHCTKEIVTNVESRIKQRLKDELNIFITGNNPVRKAEVDRIKGGGSMLQAQNITENFFPVPMTYDEDHTKCDLKDQIHNTPIFESPCHTQPDSEKASSPAPENRNRLRSPEVQNSKRQIPVIEVPYNSTTDVYLLKINRSKHERNQTDRRILNQNSIKTSVDERKNYGSSQKRDLTRASRRIYNRQ